MNGAFQIGAVGLNAQQRALEVLANNITNVNTAGFRRSTIRFSEVLATRSDGTPLAADLGESIVTTAGVRSDTIFSINEPGSIQRTGRPLDFAIEGDGFVELMGPGGQTLLWRGGTLRVGEDGALQSAAGLPLKAAITVPADASSIAIGADGVVRALGAEGGEPIEIGQIMLVRLSDESAVERLDGGVYRVEDPSRLTEARPGEDGSGTLVQGAIEGSNVELSSEMVQLLMVQRAYAANAQIVQAADQLMAIANGLRR
ncbi:MAG: flagellar basal-body rod protein FlgG [Sphingomonadales bacterium]|jgi:flagellar basal-body rod protein FlgG|nr:flagellar basal-body rod protein FlgG [Sphingomonadales bacterium]